MVAGEPGQLVFAAYNLEDYFQASDFPDGREKYSKPEKSIAAEIHVIADIHPDVLGVCEMGPPGEFDSFRARLKAAGLDYPNTEYVAGPDPERHVALLSRLPIVSRQSATDVPFPIDGRTEKVRRGFVDVTINAGSGRAIRFIGVHLKSKLRDTPENEAELRRIEAHLLRKHIDDALAADPGASLVVYGDFNDTKNSPSLMEVTGGKRAADGLKDLFLRDAQGETWTEYWKTADVYSRIDYIMVTRNLTSMVDAGHSYVYRPPGWNEASDHCPVVATLRLGGQP
jgi:endonuclease/exonuclease/phosphatase family metal-dependent hydrolase